MHYHTFTKDEARAVAIYKPVQSVKGLKYLLRCATLSVGMFWGWGKRLSPRYLK